MRPHAQNNPYTELNLFAAQMRGGRVERGKALMLFRARGLLSCRLITCSDRPGFCLGRGRAGGPHWSAEVRLALAAAALRAALGAERVVEAALEVRPRVGVRAGCSPATAVRPEVAAGTDSRVGAEVAEAHSPRRDPQSCRVPAGLGWPGLAA